MQRLSWTSSSIDGTRELIRSSFLDVNEFVRRDYSTVDGSEADEELA